MFFNSAINAIVRRYYYFLIGPEVAVLPHFINHFPIILCLSCIIRFDIMNLNICLNVNSSVLRTCVLGLKEKKRKRNDPLVLEVDILVEGLCNNNKAVGVG